MQTKLDSWLLPWCRPSRAQDELAHAKNQELESERCLQAERRAARRSGLVEAPVALVDDHRAGVGTVGEVIQAYELAHPPAGTLLHEAGDEVENRVALGKLRVLVVDRNARAPH